MGITIHYKGSLISPDLSNSFIEEFDSIASEMGWISQIVESKEFALKGISIDIHPKSESFTFLFNTIGELINPVIFIDSTMDKEHYYYQSIKTQFAPIDVHITIIKLLKYFNTKYFSNLEVTDEGCYWETSDENLLKEKIDFLTDKINLFSDMISEIPRDKDETAESIADKIEKLFKDKFN